MLFSNNSYLILNSPLSRDSSCLLYTLDSICHVADFKSSHTDDENRRPRTRIFFTHQASAFAGPGCSIQLTEQAVVEELCSFLQHPTLLQAGENFFYFAAHCIQFSLQHVQHIQAAERTTGVLPFCSTIAAHFRRP